MKRSPQECVSAKPRLPYLENHGPKVTTCTISCRGITQSEVEGWRPRAYMSWEPASGFALKHPQFYDRCAYGFAASTRYGACS